MTRWPNAPSLRALRVWTRHIVQYRSFFLAEWAGNLGEHFLYLLAFGYGLGRLVSSIGDITYAQFIGPGLVVSIAMWSSSYESTYGAYSRMRIQHTYESMLAAPLTVGDVVVGDLLWCATRALIGSTLMMIVLTSFGLVASFWGLTVFPIVFLEGLMFGSLGLIATTLAPNYAFFSFHFSIVVMPMFFFAGTFFPLTNLPAWMQDISRVLPLTHAVELARGMIVYGRVENPAWHVFVLLAYTSVFILISCWLVGRRMID